jgi:hypothetical protein
MKIIRQISNLVTRHLRKFGLMQSLTFDQQVWGAKSVMDLVQFDSRFMLAEADTAVPCIRYGRAAKIKNPMP